MNQLTDEQQEAFDEMKACKNVFITGSGGHGKSFLIRHYIDSYKMKHRIGLTSTTGVSALIIGGSTLHSYLGIGLGVASVSTLITNILKRDVMLNRWKNIRTLIIDEISMMQPELFDKLNEIGKQLRRNKDPFGGIQIVVTGDLLQLGAVKSDTFCFETQAWKECDFKVCLLTRNIRQTDKLFQSCLAKIRLGIVDEEVHDTLSSRIGKTPDPSIGIKPTALYPVNAIVDRVNQSEFARLVLDSGAKVHKFTMIETIIDKSLPSSRVEYFRKNLLVPETVELAIGAQVMLLYNLDLTHELVNGSRGVVLSIREEVVSVRFNSGIHVITPYTWVFEEETKPVIKFRQMPLKLAWSSSIHKSQGATLDCVTMDLTKCFGAGQAYVALSRVKSLEGLFIEGINFSVIVAHPKALEYYQNLAK